MISTIVLNWNRSYLLRQCIDSYLATVGEDHELFIIDNASSDDSRDYIASLESEGQATAVFLPENVGGEAFNHVIPRVAGNLVHLSENDQLFLPGWRNHVEAAFAAFPDLGQLSLFSDTPTDAEAWAAKPSHLRFARGKILYEAHGCVGTSSVVRAEVFREFGVRVHNIEQGALKFPDDTLLSSAVKAAGFWCAWSDRYYVRNVGHEISEFANNRAYYETNYESKPWVGIDGWRERIEQQNALPLPLRGSVALPDRPVVPEKTTNPVAGRPARLWSMFDGYTAEVEVIDFLYVLTRLVKPQTILETGTWLGLSACAIGCGLKANGFGRLTTLEIDPDAYEAAKQNLELYQVTSVVDALPISSMEFLPGEPYDMAIFDSELALREAEFRRFKPWLRDGAVIVFHDTAAHHKLVADSVARLLDEGAVIGIDLPTPRGIFIGKVTAR